MMPGLSWPCPAKGNLPLPGWDKSYTREELNELLKDYKGVGKEKLWQNFAYFLSRVIPVAEESGVKMAIHPDDPPRDIFGLPSPGAGSYERMKAIEPSATNGIALCFGSLGANPTNPIASIARDYADRIHFAHARNVRWTGERGFEEAPHPLGCWISMRR